MEEALSFLRDFGLSSYEIKAYLALLSVGYSTPSELSRICEVPRSRIYDVLQSLAKKGFAWIKTGKSLIYVAVVPEVALKNRIMTLKDEAYKRMAEMSKKMEAALSMLKDLSHSTASREFTPKDIARVYYNKEQFRNLLTDLIRDSRKSVSLFTSSSQGLQREEDRDRVDAIFNALARDVKFKAIHNISADTQLDLYLELEKRGAKIRIPRIELNETFWVIDGNIVAMLVENKGGKFSYGIIIQNKFMSDLFFRFFDDHWKNSIPSGDIMRNLQQKKQEERMQALKEFLYSYPH
jgi:sugar-specific transcriptional regulator TrmB